jgi:6-phosphogluconolactonase (cycloisomerase 2 family)
MAREHAPLFAFNRGVVSPLALSRVDLKRMALSATTQTNWMPRDLGSMMLRPGFEYIDSTYNNAAARHLPFIYAQDDTALIELTDGAMRVRVDDEVIERDSVGTLIRGGDFAADVTHWDKQADPGTLPQGTGLCVAWSPDGQLLAVGDGTSGFLRVYWAAAGTFSALSFPSVALPGQVNGVAFSPDSQFMGVAFSASPYFRVYAITGTGGSAVFTALADPATPPTGNANGIAFSSSSTAVTVVHATSPFISVYSIAGMGVSAALTFVATPVAGGRPASTGRGVSYSANGQYLAVAHDTTPFVTIYSISGDTYTKLADPSSLPAGAGFGVTFSRDTSYLAVAHTTTPFVTVYAIATTTFTKLVDPVSLPGGNGKGVGFSTDNQFLSVAHATTPFVTNYALNFGASAGLTTLVKETNPGTLPAGQGNGARFSPDNRWLAVAHTTTPFVTIYEAYQWLDLDAAGAASTYQSPGAPVPTVGPVTLAGSDSGWSPVTIRHVIDAGQVLVSGSSVQLVFKASGAGVFAPTKVYIGHVGGGADPYDFEFATQVTFNSGSAGFSISAGATITSDIISFGLDATRDLVVSYYMPTDDGMATTTGLTGWSTYHKLGDDASTTDASGYTDYTPSRTSLGLQAIYVANPVSDSATLSMVGTGYLQAKRVQAVSVTNADKTLRHGLSVTVSRGVVVLRVGSFFGADDIVAEVSLTEGRHSIGFVPNNNVFFVEVSSTTKYATLLDSCTIELAGAMVVTSPYSQSELDEVQFDQSGDVIYLARNGKQNYKIERHAPESWSIVKYLPEDGPFRVENTNSLITMAPAALSGDTTITSSRDFFKSTMVGALLRIKSVGQTVTAAVTAQNVFTSYIKVTGVGTDRDITVTRTGTWSATVTLQRSLTEPGAWTDATTYTTNATVTFNDGLDNQVVYYRIGVKTGGFTSGTANLTLAYASGGLVGVARITGYTNTKSVSAAVLKDFGSTTASEVWAEGAWSDRRGWPSAVCIYDGRLFWAGKDRIIGSVSDAYESFDPDTEGDAGPISRSIGSGPVARVNWMLPLQRLLLGTDGGVFSVKASSFDDPLTPTNFNVKRISKKGVARLPAVEIDSGGVFVRRGGVGVHELAYNSDIYDYEAGGVTDLAPEICSPGAVRVAMQTQPDTRIHFVLDDGTAAVLIYNPLEDVRCWIKVETDGLIEDVVVLPGTLEDQVYYVVARTLTGSGTSHGVGGRVRYLEKWALESECAGGTLNKNADSFAELVPTTPTTISSITMGANMTVGDPGFDSSGAWTQGAGWSVSGSKGVATASSATIFRSVTSGLTNLAWYNVTYTVVVTSGSVAVSLGLGTPGTSRTVSGTYTETIQSGNVGSNRITFTGTAFTGTVDDAVLSSVMTVSAPGNTLANGEVVLADDIVWAVMPGVLNGNYYTVKNNSAGVLQLATNNISLDGTTTGTYVSGGTLASTTVTGFSHLIDKPVVVWADGKCLKDSSGEIETFTVDSTGSIALANDGTPYAAATGVVGLGYDAIFESSKMAYAASLGTALGQVKKITGLTLILANTHARGIKYGVTGTRPLQLYGLPVKEGKAIDPDYIWTEYDNKMWSLDGVWETDSRLYLKASAPRPATVTAAIVGVATNDH